MNSLLRALAGELLGTFLLVFFGCGAVHSAVLTGSLTGLWQVGVVWGLAIMLAAYTVGSVSGAHINPAMSIALAAFGRFERARVVPYIAAQTVGAFLAAAVLFTLYRGSIDDLERRLAAPAGRPASIATAMCYGEYFPNPGTLPPENLAASPDGAGLAWSNRVTHGQAFGAEVLGTAILAFVVFATTDPRNAGGPAEKFAPVFIGLCVTALICVLAPLTQACFNPARDFGPRLFAFLTLWKENALPGPNGVGFFTVYIVAPIAGALFGGAAYEGLVRRSDGDASRIVSRDEP